MKLGEFINQLFGGRNYKVIDGVPWVREGFSNWEKLETHCQREHPELWDEIIESERTTPKEYKERK